MDENIAVRFLPLEEIRGLKEQIMDLASQSLYAVLADAPGGRTRFEEMMDGYAQASKVLNELVGVIMCQPNLFQLWGGEELTHLNVDTAMIKREYTGRGIFSALHNIGVFLSSSAYGFNYFEGTTIWANNDRAIKTIFPHGVPVRTHYVVQKRLLRKK